MAGALVTACDDAISGGGGGVDAADPDEGAADPDEGAADPDEGAADPDEGAADPDMEPPCMPTDEVCNGEDDDCDGVVDNGFEGLGDGCSDGLGACEVEGIIVCAEDGSATICDAAAAEPGEEVCNGEDDDCDGVPDNGFEGVGEACSVGLGACAADGLIVCNAEGTAAACDAQPGVAGDEVCNGVDDDCDGEVDDGLAGAPCETGLDGVCAAGVTACEAGEAACVQAAEAGEELCDGLDNDCDGEIDDVVGLGDECSAGVGACAVPGAVVCTPEGPACDAVAGAPAIEVCDGIDNDCNGVDDDVEGVGDDCAVGEGACAAAGAVVCSAEGPVCDAVPGDPGAEVCDGIDNDCNGVDDDVAGVGEACSAGEGACAADGVVVCSPGGPVCDAVPGDPGAEVCDGADNDCNGAIDDVDGVGEACSAGEGACAADGVVVCSPGGPVCDAVPGDPGAEVCDGADNDCNGVVDDPPVCVVPEDCATAGDEDGNGLAGCDDPVCLALPECGARMVLLCGAPERDISVIFEPADRVVLQAGCVPDADTVAMAITRDGAIDGPAVAAWLQSGGRLLTESSGTDEVFNAVFGAGVVQVAGQTGECQDNINPVVRFNEDGIFWNNNGDLPLAAGAESGCGFDLSAYPEIVPLGGWTADDVSLAYRDVGAGRFWLAEGDWQDDQQGDGVFSAATRSLMRYMLIGRHVRLTPIAAPSGAVQIVGSIDEADPTWQRGNQNCSPSRGDLHPYEAHHIVNRTGAAQSIDVEARYAGGIPGDGYLYVYTDPFDPTDFDGCIVGDDDGDQGRANSQVGEVEIADGQVLVIVISTFYGDASANNRFIGDYTVDVTTRAAP